MKKVLVLILTLLLCLLCLCACERGGRIPPRENAPSTESTQPSDQTSTETPPAEEIPQAPTAIDHLTFELVVAWEEGDRLLSELKNLSQLLRDSLLEQNYQVDDVTITISTAGGFTGDALESGGVDLALMPAVDYVACDETVLAVLTTDEDLCTTVLALSGNRTELDEAFHNALAAALLETESGRSFLEIYHPGISCVPATEEAIQAVRDWVASQETHQ